MATEWGTGAVIAVGIMVTLSAQAPKPAFEVASVRRNVSGLPTFNGSILRRRDVPPRGIVTDILYQQSLTIAQREQIESCLSEKGRIHIYLTAYFESKVGRIEVEQRIERGSL